MLDVEESERIFKNLLEKYSEINLFKKHLESNLDISMLPKVFKNEIQEIEAEIKKRKEFELFFQRIINFLNYKFIEREEKRRRE